MSQLDSVNDLLDEFEVAWEGSDPPSLARFVRDRVPLECLESELIQDLVAVDLERRWRRYGPQASEEGSGTANGALMDTVADSPLASGLPFCPNLEDYARLLPELGPYEQLPSELIADEFRIRHRWGDRPSLDPFLAAFAERHAEICDAVHSALARALLVLVRVVSRGKPVFDCALDRPLEVGRQFTDEPEPYCVHTKERLHRLIVARYDDTSVSRRFVALERTSRTTVRVTCLTSKVSIRVDSAKVGPSESVESQVPAQIELGRYKILIGFAK